MRLAPRRQWRFDRPPMFRYTERTAVSVCRAVELNRHVPPAAWGLGTVAILLCKTRHRRMVPSCCAHNDGISSRPMTDRSAIQDAMHTGGGLLRLEPCWVPRSFMHPG